MMLKAPRKAGAKNLGNRCIFSSTSGFFAKKTMAVFRVKLCKVGMSSYIRGIFLNWFCAKDMFAKLVKMSVLQRLFEI